MRWVEVHGRSVAVTTNKLCHRSCFEGSGLGGFSEVSHANKKYPYIIHGLSTDYPQVIHAGHSSMSRPCRDQLGPERVQITSAEGPE